jgi:hypothetical protein
LSAVLVFLTDIDRHVFLDFSMFKVKLFAILQCFFLLSALFVSGCATVTRSPYERFIIDTEPKGATVTLTSGETCISPCNLLKKRDEAFSCRVEKEGYEPAEVSIESKVAGAGAAGFAGNAAIGGLIGAGVDIYSGAALGLFPNPAFIELKILEKVDEKPDAPSHEDTEPLIQ